MRSIRDWAGALTLLTIGLAASAARGQCAPTWDASAAIPGSNSTAYSLLAVDEPSAIGPAVYMGVQGSSSGSGVATNIARWNGTAWSPLGTQTTNTGVVYGLTARNGVLYVAGAFTSMGGQASTRGIAQWNGTDWSSVGTGLSTSTSVRTLAFLGSDLYAGGLMNAIGGVTAHKLAKWNGSAWSALPGNPINTDNEVYALAVYDDGNGLALYAGGEFPDVGGNTTARNIFRWDGTNVTALGQGANDDVEALVVWGGDLYVGGQFTRVYQSDGTEVIANKVARWDGAQWHTLGSGMDTPLSTHVWTLSVYDAGGGESLYAGGSFTSAGGAARKYVASWDGGAWNAVGASNLNGYVYALATSSHDGGLYLGGTFTSAGMPSANRIARWAGPLPRTPIDAAADPALIDVGQSSVLSASSAGATINWYTGGCGETLVGTGGILEIAPTETSTYYARAFNGACASYACDSVTVTVECAPEAPQDAAADPAEIFVGESATLSASAGDATIHWYTGECGGTFVGTGGVIAVSPLETTTYYARAWNGFCYSATCDWVSVIVNCIPLEITQQPQGGAICTPSAPAMELCVVAEGAGTLRYQWRRNSLAMVGATGACHLATQAGSYACVVTDDCIPVLSDVAVVGVAHPQLGDLDGDGEVDAADLAALVPCLAGPMSFDLTGCECADIVADGQIDLVDFAAFQTMAAE